MAKYEVLISLRDKKTKEMIKKGAIIDRAVKAVEAFEKKFGDKYLKRVDGQNDQQTEEKTKHK